MGLLSFVLNFVLNVTAISGLLFFVGKTEGQSILAVGHHSSMHTCVDDASTAIMWAVPCNNYMYMYYC